LILKLFSGVRLKQLTKYYQVVMQKIHRKVEYALIALKYMSGKYAGQLTTVKEICAHTNIPFDATSRVMQLMAQEKILKAEHGAHGGYLLIKDLSKLSFLNIIEVISGKVEAVRCVNGQSECEFFANCNVASPLKNFNTRLAEFYQSLTLAELLNSNGSSHKESHRENKVGIL
jgi:Rrf2 family transcriptional regulator, nitric oxide-sensitive transcriptional repressor